MKILNPLLFIIIALTFVQCSDDNEAPQIPEDEQEPEEMEYEWVQTHTIGSFITTFGDEEVMVDTIAITGFVISSDEEQNFINQLVISDGDDAVRIQVEGDKLYESFPLGREVLLKCVGLKLFTSNRTIALANGDPLSADDESEPLLLQDGETNIQSGFVALDNIRPQDLNKYVQVLSYQVAEEEVGQPYIENNALTRKTITNDDGLVAQLVFNPGSSFEGQTIPSLAGAIRGILSVENDVPTITPLSTEDLFYTNDRRGPYEKMTFSFGENTLPYQIMYPRDYNPNNSYPLVVFLHGAGERGTNNTSQMDCIHAGT
jgi:hypothetical protein